MKKFKMTARQIFTKRGAGLPVLLLAGLLASSALMLSVRGAINEAADLAISAGNAPAETAHAAGGVMVAQTALTGQWVAQFDASRPAFIELMFTRRSEGDGSFMISDNISRNELQGLPADAATTAKTNVTFRIVREAGTFDCEGYFNAGKGAGFWRLTPSQSFVAAMRGRGYDNLKDEDLLKAALHNLTTKFIDDLKSVGYDRLDFQQVLRAAGHNVSAAYVREMQAAGYEGLTTEELVRARNHEIDSRYVKEVQAMGFAKQPLESLIRLRNHEITQEFIDQMRSIGFDNLSIEELIRLKNHEITPEYVNGLKAEGYSDISVDAAIRLKNHEIDRDFIRRVKAKGFANLTLDQLVRLRSNDIVK